MVYRFINGIQPLSLIKLLDEITIFLYLFIDTNTESSNFLLEEMKYQMLLLNTSMLHAQIKYSLFLSNCTVFQHSLWVVFSISPRNNRRTVSLNFRSTRSINTRENQFVYWEITVKKKNYWPPVLSYRQGYEKHWDIEHQSNIYISSKEK